MERQPSSSSLTDRSTKEKREKQEKKEKKREKKEKKEKEKKEKHEKEKERRSSGAFGRLKELSKSLLYEQVLVELDENGNERPLSAEAARAAKEQQKREKRQSASLSAAAPSAVAAVKPAAATARQVPPASAPAPAPARPAPAPSHSDEEDEGDEDDDDEDDESSSVSAASSRSSARTRGGREVSATLDASDLREVSGSGRSWAQVAVAEEQWQVAKEREAAAWRSDAAALVFLLPDEAPRSAAAHAVHDPLGIFSEAQVAAAASRYRALPAKDQLPGSMAVSSDDFNPVLFLTEVHRNTSWADLMRGAEQLERRLQEEHLQLKTLANDNFDEFLLCKDTVDALHSEIRAAELNPEGSASTTNIERTIESVRADAASLFEPLLALRREADKVRRTLQLLNKYRFLLRLPAELDRGLRRGDPEAVVADYRRALTLRLDQVSALRPVWQLVTDKLAGLQRELLARLDDPLEDWDQQRRTMRLLLALSTRPHPVVRFLATQQAHLCTLLDAIAADPQAEELTRVKLVKKLTKVVLLHVPDLARLVQALSQDQPSATALSQLVATVAERYSDRVREALTLPLVFGASATNVAVAAAGSLSVDQASAFSDCITVVRGCDEQLTAVSMSAVAIQQLVADSSAYLIEQLCSQMVREAALLYVNEDWQPRAGARSGGATALPDALELLVCETVRDLRPLVPDSSPHQGRVFNAITETLRAFTDTLHHLAFEMRLQGPQAGTFLSLMDQPDGPAPPTLTPLLVVAANCRYTRTAVVPHILAACQKDFPTFPRDARAEELEGLCTYLEQLIAGRYVALVSENLSVSLQRGVQALRGHTHPPDGPSEALMHSLVRLVFASAELQALAPFLLPRCVPQLYENLMLIMVEAVTDAGPLTREAVLQVELDHAYLTEVMRSFTSPDTAALSKSLRSVLRRSLKKRDHTAEELERTDALLSSAIRRTSGLFLCLNLTP